MGAFTQPTIRGLSRAAFWDQCTDKLSGTDKQITLKGSRNMSRALTLRNVTVINSKQQNSKDAQAKPLSGQRLSRWLWQPQNSLV